MHSKAVGSSLSLDIQAIDNLNSKRQDLAADVAMLFSNSGCTKNALRKAERIEIDAVSAIAAENSMVRPVIERELVAKRLSVDSLQITLYPSKDSGASLKLPRMTNLTKASMTFPAASPLENKGPLLFNQRAIGPAGI